MIDEIEFVAGAGTSEEARQRLEETRRQAIQRMTDHYDFTARGGRGLPEGTAWEGALIRALEARLGERHQTLGLAVDGWYWS